MSDESDQSDESVDSEETASPDEMRAMLDTETEFYQNFVSCVSVNSADDKPPAADEYPTMWELQRDISHHGHTHVIVDGHERELEMFRGTTTFNYNSECIELDVDEYSDHMIRFDAVTHWYEPRGLYHE